MPTIPFDALPDTARVWVFAADRPVTGERAERLLAEVDRFLAAWHAHGHPLSCARDWRDDRFLTVGVDQSEAHASGCSVDGLFRAFRALEPAIGATMLGSGNVYFRDPGTGAVHAVSRAEFAELAAAGTITDDTRVFDPTVTSLGEWYDHFETEVGRSWHAQLR
jgi:hypothetical protein